MTGIFWSRLIINSLPACIGGIGAQHGKCSNGIERRGALGLDFQNSPLPPPFCVCRMSISLDHTAATKILFEESASAGRGDSTALVETWRERTAELGRLCPHGKSATVIAALGTALLAKATNDQIDVYALLDRGEAPTSYSARSLADGVWAKNRAVLDVDLGANGVNPLNNTPFIGKTRIDEITGVRNRSGWKYFLECMEAAKALSSCEAAREALRGFILARSHSVLPPIAIDPQAGDNLTATTLVQLIDKYVAQDSEGGRRAQACVAAMLDTVFGQDRVLVGVINDPDRNAPLDVSVTEGAESFLAAFEVKDKPILDHHVRSSIEKTVRDHGLKNLGFVAISKQQATSDFDATIQWAALRGVKITVFLTWQSFYQACKCFAPACTGVFEGQVFRRILARAAELSVLARGLEWLQDAAKPGGANNST